MQKLTASHKQTSAQPVLEQQLTLERFAYLWQGFIAKRDVMRCGMHLCSIWVSCQAVSSPTLLPTCSLLAGGIQSENLRKPWHCTSTVQQSPKCWGVISNVLVTDPKQNTIQDPTKKIDSTPDRSSDKETTGMEVSELPSSPRHLKQPKHRSLHLS